MKSVAKYCYMIKSLGFALLFCLSSSFAFADSYFLMMAEQDNCPFCEKWRKEVGVIYPKTPEGKVAPLKKFHINQQLNIDFKKPVRFTPTFILVRDNQELARIEGYRGDEHFWTLISVIFKQTNISINDEV